MEVYVVPPAAGTIFAPTSSPASIASDITTNPTTIPQVTSTAGVPATRDMTLVTKVSRALYNATASIVTASMGSILMLAFFDWQLPPLPFI